MSLVCTGCKYAKRMSFLGCYSNPQDFADEDRHYWEGQTGEDQPEENWENMEYRRYIRTVPCPYGHEGRTMIFTGEEW